MLKLIGSASMLAVSVLATAGGWADEAGADAPALAGYTRTGHFESCLNSHLIRSSKLLSKQQLLFQLASGGAYLAEANCSSFSTDYAISYDATPGKLCNSTVVLLIEPGSGVRTRGTCSIERFEKLEKK